MRDRQRNTRNHGNAAAHSKKISKSIGSATGLNGIMQVRAGAATAYLNSCKLYVLYP
jgi:hypothetical protein